MIIEPFAGGATADNLNPVSLAKNGPVTRREAVS